jgi:ferrous iron transport protein B
MSTPFIMELPPYRIPTIRGLLLHMWERAWMYLRKAGTIILAISIIMWFLVTFPVKQEFTRDYDKLISEAQQKYRSGQISGEEQDESISGYVNARAFETMEYSLAGKLGKFIEPAIKPLGFDWRLGLAAISGFAAKEVVVSTMGTIYGVGDTDAESASLRARLANDPKYSKLTAYSFMVFVLLYMPCLASLAVFLRETRSWKELLFQVGYTTGLAWIIAFLMYQGGKILGLG